MASNPPASGFVTGSQSFPETENRPPKSTCRVCGDEIGYKENGELFSACHVCAFPVCRPCYDYERSDGNQCCPQCNTRYKRHKGCPRVAGDDDDSFDEEDFEDEFPIKNRLQVDHSDRNPLANDSDSGDNNNNKNNRQWQHNGHAFSVGGSVVGKEFEGEREGYGNESNDDWKDRVEKWKVRQERRGNVINKDDGNNDEGDEDDYIKS